MEGSNPDENNAEPVIRFTCDICGQRIRVPKSYAGKKGKCPKCKNAVVIPQPVPPPSDDEPIRLIRDPVFPAKPVNTASQEWHKMPPSPPPEMSEYADTMSPQPEQKPATILNVFTFSFSLAGALHFLLFWLGPYILGLCERYLAICCYFQLLIGGLYIALIGYFYLYLAHCIIAAAKDERYAPDMSFEDTPGFLELIGRVLKVAASVLMCFGPVLLYVVFVYWMPGYRAFWGRPQGPPLPDWRTDPLYWILYGLGVFLFPMYLLAIAMFDSATAFNPVLIIGSIISTFVPYCGLALLFFAIGLLMNFAGRALTSGFSLPILALNIYLTFIAAYILGRFFRRYEDRLNWEIKL